MPNIISHHRNTNKITMEYHFIPIRMAIIRRKKGNRYKEEVEKLIPSYTASRNVNRTTTLESS